MMQNAVGQRLKRLREAEQMTQTQLAKVMGLTQGHLSLIEKGKRPLPVSALDRLAARMGEKANTILDSRNAGVVSGSLAKILNLYDKGHNAHYQLVKQFEEVSRFLRKHLNEFLKQLDDDADRMALKHWAEQAVGERPRFSLSPPRSEVPELRYLEGASLPDFAMTTNIFELLSVCSQLRGKDIQLLIEIATRLGRNDQADEHTEE